MLYYKDHTPYGESQRLGLPHAKHFQNTPLDKQQIAQVEQWVLGTVLGIFLTLFN